MRPHLALALAVALALGAGCNSNFTPASQVDSLQVLGVKAEPPDLRPGGTSVLTILVVDPAQSPPEMTTVFLGCDPDPTGVTETACAQYQDLEDVSQLLELGPDGGASLAVSGARLLGFNADATYTAPPGLFDSLAPDDINRERGVLADVLSLTVAEVIPIPPTAAQLQGVIGRVQSKVTPSALALKEIRVTQTDVLNTNPVLGFVTTSDQILDAHRGLALAVGATEPLSASTEFGADQTYLSIGPDGSSETLTAFPIYSWFTTAGSFVSDRTTVGSPPQALTAPGSGAIPKGRTFELWVVVRDERGGEDWGAFPGFICDPSQPTPTVTSSAFLEPTQALRVTFSGEHLDQVLDVAVEGLPVVGQYDATTGTWSGTLPAGGSGTVAVALRGTDCQSAIAEVLYP